MLAGATIAGIVYTDVTGGGFSSSNVPAQGVEVLLNGMTTTHVAVDESTDTLASGSFTFTDVQDGTYTVSEVPPSGSIQTGGPAAYAITVTSGVASSSTSTNIDNFADPDPATNYTIGMFNSNATDVPNFSTGVLGDYRHVLVNVVSTVGPSSASGFVGTESGVMVFDLGADSLTNSSVLATLQYDGYSTPETFVSPSGLMPNPPAATPPLNADLTNGGVNTGIQIGFQNLTGQDNSQVNVTINATSPSGTVTFSTELNQSFTAFSLYADFSNFTFTPIGAATKFDWADVTNLNVVFNGGPTVPAVDLAVNSISAIGYSFANYTPPTPPPTPGSISGEVYVDTNANGVLNTGEPPISGVMVTLTGTNYLGQTITPLTTTTNAAGIYTFPTVLPGTYVITVTQPENFIEGSATPGSTGGNAPAPPAASRVITSVPLVVGGDDVSVGNNFGELGLAPAYVSKRMFLYPVVLPTSYSAVYDPAMSTSATGIVTAFAAASSGSSQTAASASVATPATITASFTNLVDASSDASAAAALSASSLGGSTVVSAPLSTTSPSATAQTSSTSTSTAGAVATAAISASNLDAAVKKTLLQ